MSSMHADIQMALARLPLGRIRFFEVVTSTNDIAAEWAAHGAPHFSLVIADEQTAGRGRDQRRWYTPPGTALAFSLILHPSAQTVEVPLGRYAALGALAVQQALYDGYGLPALIKWPNDVLVGGAKVGGVLAEAVWEGDQPRGVIIGIGVNAAPGAVPLPTETRFPATSVESALGRGLDRWELLGRILAALLAWYARLPAPDFVEEWERRLAFRGERVRLGETDGVLAGLTAEGFLRLETAGGERAFPAGELHLCPVDSA